MTYDTMSAADILRELWIFGQTRTTWGTQDSPFVLTGAVEQEKELVAALRKAVIREVSVGEIVIEQHEGYLSPEPLFSVGSDSKLKAGTFYIVPKEVS